jgi:hypothetical protein
MNSGKNEDPKTFLQVSVEITAAPLGRLHYTADNSITVSADQLLSNRINN